MNQVLLRVNVRLRLVVVVQPVGDRMVARFANYYNATWFLFGLIRRVLKVIPFTGNATCRVRPTLTFRRRFATALIVGRFCRFKLNISFQRLKVHVLYQAIYRNLGRVRDLINRFLIFLQPVIIRRVGRNLDLGRRRLTRTMGGPINVIANYQGASLVMQVQAVYYSVLANRVHERAHVNVFNRIHRSRVQ